MSGPIASTRLTTLLAGRTASLATILPILSTSSASSLGLRRLALPQDSEGGLDQEPIHQFKGAGWDDVVQEVGRRYDKSFAIHTVSLMDLVHEVENVTPRQTFDRIAKKLLNLPYG